MPSITPADLARYRASVNTSLGSTALIRRTNVTTPCRVSSMKGTERIEGLPFYLHPFQWQLVFPDGTDVKMLDHALVTNVNEYLVLRVSDPMTYSAGTYAQCVTSGAPVTASTTRGGHVPALGATSGQTAHLSALTLHPVGDYLLMAMSQQWIAETFGIASDLNATQVFVILASWPPSSAWVDQTQIHELHPVKPHDFISINGTSYEVLTTENWSPDFMLIYVSAPA